MKMKKFLSFLLVLCMMMSLVSVSALASDGDAPPSGGTEVSPPPHQHSWDGGSVTQVATCAAKGLMTYTCTDASCGATYDKAIDSPAHNWNSGTVSKESSCSEAGVLTYTCLDCGASYDDSIEKLSHNWNSGEIITESSCSAAGAKLYTCSCGAKYTEELKKLDHDWNNGEVSKEATCSAEGEMLYTCACGATYTEATKMLNHTWDEGELTKEPNCTEWGVMSYTCTVCGATKTVDDEVLPKGHQWNGGEVTSEATIYADGVMTYTCTVCEDTATDSIARIVCKDCRKFCDAENPNTACEVCAADASLCKGERLAFTAKSVNFTVTLDKSSATYKGISLTPGWTVKDGETVLDRNTHFTPGWYDVNNVRQEKGLVNVGTYTFIATGKNAYSGKSASADFTIIPADLTVKAKDITITYGETIPTVTYEITGAVNGQSVNCSASFSVATPKDAGTYSIIPKVDSIKSDSTDINLNNYNITYINGTLTINKAEPTVTPPTAKDSLKYNGENQTLIKAGSVKNGTISYSLSEKGTYSSSLPYAAKAGTYKVWYKVTGDKNYKDIGPVSLDVTIAELTAEDISALIKGLGWLPGGQVDPGNKHQRSEVLHVWNMYNLLSAKEQARVPSKQFDWLYYLVSNTDYSIINGSGSYWYEGKKSGINFTAIDPSHNFVGVYVDGYLISSSNYSAWWTGDNQYDEDDLVVVSLKPGYLETLKLGKHRISIAFDNGYAPGHFYVVEANASPRTGDTANTPLWAGLMLGSALAMAAAGFMLRKKKEN